MSCPVAVCFSDCLCNPCTSSFGREIALAGAEFTWKYYAGFYNKDNLPAEATRTWVTKTIAPVTVCNAGITGSLLQFCISDIQFRPRLSYSPH